MCSPGSSAPSPTVVSIHPTMPIAPNVIGPTVERASMSTAERSGETQKRCTPCTSSTGTSAARRGRSGGSAGSLRAGVTAGAAPFPLARDGVLVERTPPDRGFGEERLGRAARQVATQHPVERVAFLLDDAHPRAQRALAVFGEAVDPARLARLRLRRPRLHQAVLLELRERAVHRGTVDVAEAERGAGP